MFADHVRIMDTWKKVSQNWFGEDDFENPAQPVSPSMLHMMYYLNGLEDIILLMPIIPLRVIPLRSVIWIKEVGPNHHRNYCGKIRCTAYAIVPCPAYFKKLMLQAQPKGSHEVNSPYRPNTLELVWKRMHDLILVMIEIFSSEESSI